MSKEMQNRLGWINNATNNISKKGEEDTLV